MPFAPIKLPYAEDALEPVVSAKTISFHYGKHHKAYVDNTNAAIKGTPLENNPKVDVWDMIRMIATARILMPGTMVRLSAGRAEMSQAEQALCFMAGANSIFAGEKLLTTPNPSFEEDNLMFELLGLKPRVAFKDEKELAAVN